jgi:hypothetical protein
MILVAHALGSRVEELQNRKWKFEIREKAKAEALGGRFIAGTCSTPKFHGA